MSATSSRSYTFPNSEHVVKDRPDVDSTFRDILAYVAELSGTLPGQQEPGRWSWFVRGERADADRGEPL